MCDTNGHEGDAATPNSTRLTHQRRTGGPIARTDVGDAGGRVDIEVLLADCWRIAAPNFVSAYVGGATAPIQDPLMTTLKRAMQAPGRTIRWIWILVGLGAIAGALWQLQPVARANIQLHRDQANAVVGSYRLMLGPVPIYYQDLDGLSRVEEELRTYSRTVKGVHRGEVTEARLNFLDDSGRVLAWSERVAVKNDAYRLQAFLRGTDQHYQFQQVNASDPWVADVYRIGCALLFLLIGLAFVLSGFNLPILSWLERKPRRKTLQDFLP